MQCVVPRRPMVGFPILPRPKLVLADEDATQWRWLRRRPGGRKLVFAFTSLHPCVAQQCEGA